MNMINRRQSIERISLMLGGTLSTQLTAGLMGQVLNEGPSVEVSEAQTQLLAEVADIIIPTTDTPGAKAAGVEQFIIRVLRDCYLKEDQEKFYNGLAKLEADSRKSQGKGFVDIDTAGKTEVLQNATKSNKAWFKEMKQFTVTGYFISEIGASQALEYLPIPGKFEGDIPFKPGQRVWAIKP